MIQTLLSSISSTVELGFADNKEQMKELISAVKGLSFLHPGVCAIEGAGQIDGVPAEVSLLCEVTNPL